MPVFQEGLCKGNFKGYLKGNFGVVLWQGVVFSPQMAGPWLHWKKKYNLY